MVGAYDYIEKPFQTDKLLHLVERATETERLRQENEELKKKAGRRTAKDSETAIREVEARLPALVVLDIWLRDSKRDGLEILKIPGWACRKI